MTKRESPKARLARLEREIKELGVALAYERLQFAGLQLASGLCWFKGRYYLFVDRRKPVSERIDHLERALEDLAGGTVLADLELLRVEEDET